MSEKPVVPGSSAEIVAKIAVIKDKFAAFIQEANKTTNQSAARRARKISMELRQLLKEFKAASVKA